MESCKHQMFSVYCWDSRIYHGINRRQLKPIRAKDKVRIYTATFYSLAVFFILIFWSKSIFADVPNTFFGHGLNRFVVEVESSRFPSRRAGATLQVSYVDASRRQYGLFYINETGKSRPMSYFRSETQLPRSTINPGYLKLNDNLDVQVEIGSRHIVPFNWTTLGTPGIDLVDGFGYNSRFDFGLRGVLRLKLRRDIIGGAVLLDRDVLVTSVYRSMSLTPPPAWIPQDPEPAFEIALEGQIVPTPVECRITNVRGGDVRFGDLNAADITTNGSRYGQEILLSYQCNSELSLPIKLDLVAASSSFSNNFIATSNPDLGIVMKHGDTTVRPWSSFTSILLYGKGGDRIYVAPVKNPAAKTISTGDFTAFAVLIMSIL
ncbi:fimbrial protein [Serratia aquatilis]|uniref:Fimbrial protein n=1 Tax=Serratia aquatilis TaxID=1737515 RepID=A0ABV6ED23_9GAMM